MEAARDDSVKEQLAEWRRRAPERIQARRKKTSRERKRGCVVGCAAAAAAVILMVCGALVTLTQWYFPNIRREAIAVFQRDAIAEVTRLTQDTKWIEERLAPIAEVTWNSAWFSQDMIIMTNCEWIVCQAGCRKSNWKIDDIFIGRASDGKWYYTTYHFCTQMSWLEGNGPSKSLASFAKDYSLREFSGDLTATLSPTWPESVEEERSRTPPSSLSARDAESSR